MGAIDDQRAAEQERQMRINQGVRQIEEVFAPYYGYTQERVANPDFWSELDRIADAGFGIDQRMLRAKFDELGGDYLAFEEWLKNNRPDQYGRVPLITLASKETDPNATPFWEGARKAQTDLLMPQLEQQQQDTADQLLYALARSGNLRSSVANDRQARLLEDRDLAIADVSAKGEATAEKVRQGLEQEKAAAMAMLQTTANPALAANSAAAAAKAVSTEPLTTTLEPLFVNTLEGLAFANTPRYGYQFNPTSGGYSVQGPGSPFGGGSDRIVK